MVLLKSGLTCSGLFLFLLVLLYYAEGDIICITLNEHKNPFAGMQLDEGQANTNPPKWEVYSLSHSFSGDKKVKRKIALVVGYIGTNFRGMQIHREAGKSS